MRIHFLLTQDLESPSGLGRYFPMARELVRLGHQVTISALHSDYANLKHKDEVVETLKGFKKKWYKYFQETREVFKENDGTNRPDELVHIWRELLTVCNTRILILPLDAEGLGVICNIARQED